MQVTLSELAQFAQDFVKNLPRSLGTRAHVVGLSGDLGAGKTTLVQHIARELGVTESVTSPTFVIAERYPLSHAPFTSLIHVDAYRLEEKEIPTIGWDAFVQDPCNLIVVEWPERLGTHFPVDAPVIRLAVVDEYTRAVHV